MTNKRIYIAARGCGKTKWLINSIFKEYKNNPNRTFLYVGDERTYHYIADRYLETYNKRCPIIYAISDEFIIGCHDYDTVCFTDNLFGSGDIAFQHKRQIENRNIPWYITIDDEDIVTE